MTVNTTDKIIPRYTLAEISNKPGTLFEARRVDVTSVKNIEQMFVPHRKDYYFFFLVKKGSSYHWVDFLRYQVQPHNVYFTLPHQVHLKERTEPMEGMLLTFTEEYLTLCNDDTLRQLPVLLNKGQKHAIELKQEEEVFLENLFEQIIIEFTAEQTFKSAALQAYTKLLLVYLSRVYERLFPSKEVAGNGSELFKKLTHLLDKKFNTLHQPADYAEALHVTVGHLNAVVKTHMGQTVTDLVQDRIILEAKRLLFHSELSIKEIGYKLGFEDAAYFNRFFKRRTGDTPLYFRQQNHEKYH